jgi:hypothetical protein
MKFSSLEVEIHLRVTFTFTSTPPYRPQLHRLTLVISASHNPTLQAITPFPTSLVTNNHASFRPSFSLGLIATSTTVLAERVTLPSSRNKRLIFHFLVSPCLDLSNSSCMLYLRGCNTSQTSTGSMFSGSGNNSPSRRSPSALHTDRRSRMGCRLPNRLEWTPGLWGGLWRMLMMIVGTRAQECQRWRDENLIFCFLLIFGSRYWAPAASKTVIAVQPLIAMVLFARLSDQLILDHRSRGESSRPRGRC